MGQNTNSELLTEGLKDHVSIAREKVGIDETTAIELWYYSEDEGVRDDLTGVFSDFTFNRESRIANTWDASVFSPPRSLGNGWGFLLGGREMTLWVTEHSPSQPT